MTIAEVINWKHPHKDGMSTSNGVIVEFPGGIPSQADQDTWTTEYEAHLAATAYVEKRVDAYPTIEEQLDMQYWDNVNGTTKWKTAIAKVKTDNPKPD